ncbi:MAG: glycosyl transferase family 1, partial [Anaerolineaceae bacterium 4572_78]
SKNLNGLFINLPREKDGYHQPKLDQIFGMLLDEIRPDIAHVGHLNHLSTGIIDELHARQIPIVFTLHDFWLMCPRGQFLQRNFGQIEFHQLCHGQENQKCARQCYNAYFSGQENDNTRDMAYWTDWIASRMNKTRRIVEKVDVFIAPSRYLQNRFINSFHVPSDKIIYLDYGFPSYLKPLQKAPHDLFTFGYIGTHIPAKGVNLLIESFSKLHGRAMLKIWGHNKGQNNYSLKRLAETCKSANKQIQWMGEYANKEIAQNVFAHVDAIVVPSIWAENSPLVIHEAQACHVPVITADNGGMCEYVQHNVNGLLFEHRNVHDLTSKMQYALTHPHEMVQLGKRGYLYDEYGEVLSVQKHCQELQQVYKRLIL